MLSGRGMRGNYREILGVVKRSVIYFSLFSVKKNGALSSQPGFLLSSIKDSDVFMMYLLFFSDNWVFVF